VVITVLKNNAPWGPFTRAQIQDGLVRGDFTLQYLAHSPGLKEWLPLGEVLDHVDRSALLPPVPTAQAGGIPVPEVGRGATLKTAEISVLPPPLPPIKPASVQATLPVVEKPEVLLRPASFLLRLIAFVIDCVILFVPVALIFALKAITMEVQGAWNHIDHQSRMEEWALLNRNFHQLLLLIAIGLGWLYAAGLECSRWQGTVGKQWVGIKVTDALGERISFPRASGRHAAKYLSALPCFLGFVAALFSSRGMALHDRLADTRVVRD